MFAGSSGRVLWYSGLVSNPICGRPFSLTQIPEVGPSFIDILIVKDQIKVRAHRWVHLPVTLYTLVTIVNTICRASDPRSTHRESAGRVWCGRFLVDVGVAHSI